MKSVQNVGDMDPDDFRRHGRDCVEWVASYLEHPEDFPVFARSAPGDLVAKLPTTPPPQAEPMEAILEDFRFLIVPGITHWASPGWFAYFSSSASAPAILAEILAAGLSVNAMLWRTSPAATELEEVVTDWLRQMLGLPADFRGVLMDSASISTLVALAAAREQVPGLNARQDGLCGRGLPPLRLYTSEQAHSSIDKAAVTLGIGQHNVRKVPTDEAFRMDPMALELAIEDDIRQGAVPFCVVASLGTTGPSSLDSLSAIGAVCRRKNLWLHVDGAYGAMAAIAPEFRHILNGIETVQSLVVNPHKWLFVPLECSAFFIRRPEVLKRAFSVVPEYLRTVEGDVNNYMDWGPQLSRRFRALKLWFVIRHFGHDGLADRIREHVRLARRFASWIDKSPAFERLAPTPLSTVCFRAHPAGLNDGAALDALNEDLLSRVNARGAVFLSHTKLRGRYTLRLTIGNIRTQEKDVALAWAILQSELEALTSGRLRPLVGAGKA